MNKIVGLALAAAVVAGIWIAVRTSDGPEPGKTLLGSAVYTCDEGRTISAAFYEGPDGGLGTVEVSLDGGASTTLGQTMSADGARYATIDESFVFWNKGDEALVMRDNAMDLTYTNCSSAR